MISTPTKRGRKERVSVTYPLINKNIFRLSTSAVIWLLALSALVSSTAAVAQQPGQSASSLPKAQQVQPLSGRTASAGFGSVTTQQTPQNGGSGANTINSTIQVTGAYQGSANPSASANSAQAPITLNIAEAIRLALRYNLGGLSANASVRQLRGQRLAALAEFLPTIFGTLSETAAKIDLQSEGLSSSTFGGALPIPTTVGPFHYYGALANASESLSFTSLYNLRSAQAAADAAQMNAEDAHQLIILAVSGTYLQVLADKANVASQEAQVKQAEATYTQTQRQFEAGTKAVVDRNRSFVEFHTEQERLSSLRGGLTKQTMQLARLIGLPVGQVINLVEDLPSQVPPAISVDDEVKLALDERSDLKAAKLQLRAAEESRRSSRSEYLPSLSVNGNYGLEGQNPQQGGVAVFQAAASVTIPIFQGGRVRADLEQADAAISQRQAEYADEKGAVELDVRQAYVDLQVAAEQVDVAKENRKVAAETFQQSVDRFAAGVTTSVEVVQSQESVAAAERDYIGSLFSLNLARISLARATGQIESFIPNMLKGN
jgi:outer membrane protein TolC